MKISCLFCLRILALPLFLLCSALPAATIKNDDIVKMVKAGLDEDIILSSIKNSDAQFDTSATGLIALSEAKVPKTIVTAMLERPTGNATAKNRPPPKQNAISGPSTTTTGNDDNAADVSSVIALDTGQEVRLSYTRCEVKTRIRALGFGGGAGYMCIDGPRAKNRFKSRDPIFFAWLPRDAVPETQVDLTVWAIRKDNTREIMCANVGFGSSTSGFPKERLLQMEFKKMEEVSSDGKFQRYQLKPTRSLSAGEFVLIFGETVPRCYDFGID